MKLLLAFSAAVLWSSVVSAQSPDFAYYNLSLIWPASFCTPATKDCISPIPKIFTISGVWPTLKNGTALPPYDPVDNVCNDSPAAPVAWATQGMCCDYPRDPSTYFATALNLAENSTYDPLKANAKEKVGSYPQIACSVVSNKLYLRGVRYCFTRAKPNPPTALQDCPSQMDAVCTSVPAAQRNVIFPPTPVSDSGHRVTGELLASA
ncbi:hypothetical protein V6N13_033087 [Hibiscus sabdariffa]